MGKFSIYFAGREILLPGVYSRVVADAMVPERGTVSRAIAILAPGEGGEVGSYTRITSPTQIKKLLVGGTLARLTELAMGPSGDVVGANDIYAIRVNKAVKATLNLGDATLSARMAGKVGNAVGPGGHRRPPVSPGPGTSGSRTPSGAWPRPTATWGRSWSSPTWGRAPPRPAWPFPGAW